MLPKKNFVFKSQTAVCFLCIRLCKQHNKGFVIKLSSYGLVFLWNPPWKLGFFSLITQKSDSGKITIRFFFFSNGVFFQTIIIMGLGAYYGAYYAPRLLLPHGLSKTWLHYAFDDTCESSSDCDDTALTISTSIQDQIISSINSVRELKKKCKKKRP